MLRRGSGRAWREREQPRTRPPHRPQRHRALFPGLIDGLPRPHAAAVAWDLLAAAPLRTMRDGLRYGAKWLLLAVGGKQGLDRVKLLLHRR